MKITSRETIIKKEVIVEYPDVYIMDLNLYMKGKLVSSDNVIITDLNTVLKTMVLINDPENNIKQTATIYTTKCINGILYRNTKLMKL